MKGYKHMRDSEVSPSEFDTPLLMTCDSYYYVVSNYCHDNGSLSIVMNRFDNHKDATRYLQYKRDEISSEEYYYPEVVAARLARVQARRSTPPRCMKHNTLLMKYRDDSGAYVTRCPTCSGWDI